MDGTQVRSKLTRASAGESGWPSDRQITRAAVGIHDLPIVWPEGRFKAGIAQQVLCCGGQAAGNREGEHTCVNCAFKTEDKKKELHKFTSGESLASERDVI